MTAATAHIGICMFPDKILQRESYLVSFCVSLLSNFMTSGNSDFEEMEEGAPGSNLSSYVPPLFYRGLRRKLTVIGTDANLAPAFSNAIRFLGALMEAFLRIAFMEAYVLGTCVFRDPRGISAMNNHPTCEK